VSSISPERWQAASQSGGVLARAWGWAEPYVLGTLVYGTLAGAAALAVAGVASVRRNFGLLVVAIGVFLIGGELLAIADIRIYNRPTPWPLSLLRVSGHDLFGWVYNNAPVMVIAYLGRFAWIALLAGEAMWSRPFLELRSAAAVDGASPWRAAASVVWPIGWPILAGAAVLVMLLAMTEVSATVLLSPQRPQMLVPLLMGWVHMLRYDDMLEGSLLMMAAVMVLGGVVVSLVWIGMRAARRIGTTQDRR
jgi:ABC-type Fe3+ transport system permease subunit